MTAAQDAKAIITGILVDFAQTDQMLDYMQHAGFDFGAITDTEQLLPAWLGFYRTKKGQYDITRALLDLQTWPPMARRIAQGLSK